ncbi:hypothetical protein K7432_014175 [Basidiobolus ranarum]|uniref:Secreted protein n=1 Tax=Basidiobolus ranarum TaxID=34480 RepID=A0ABR2WHZ2_9FUNG
MQLTITILLSCAALVQVVHSSPVNYPASVTNPLATTGYNDVENPESSTQLPPLSSKNTQVPVWKHVFTTITNKQNDPNNVETMMKKESSFEYQTVPSTEAKGGSAQSAFGKPNDLETPTDPGSEQTSQELPSIRSDLEQDGQLEAPNQDYQSAEMVDGSTDSS